MPKEFGQGKTLDELSYSGNMKSSVNLKSQLQRQRDKLVKRTGP